MISDQLRRVPFGHGVWGVVVASIIAIILVLAYVDGPRSVTGGAFALGALALLGRQLQALRNRGGRTL
jgi:hypothetical protein